MPMEKLYNWRNACFLKIHISPQFFSCNRFWTFIGWTERRRADGVAPFSDRGKSCGHSARGGGPRKNIPLILRLWRGACFGLIHQKKCLIAVGNFMGIFMVRCASDLGEHCWSPLLSRITLCFWGLKTSLYREGGGHINLVKKKTTPQNGMHDASAKKHQRNEGRWRLIPTECRSKHR